MHQAPRVSDIPKERHTLLQDGARGGWVVAPDCGTEAPECLSEPPLVAKLAPERDTLRKQGARFRDAAFIERDPSQTIRVGQCQREAALVAKLAPERHALLQPRAPGHIANSAIARAAVRAGAPVRASAPSSQRSPSI